MYYNVHYPDGDVKKHKTRFKDTYMPGLEKVFFNARTVGFNLPTYYIIVEMNETDIWVEEIDAVEYNRAMCTACSFAYFIYADDYHLLVTF